MYPGESGDWNALTSHRVNPFELEGAVVGGPGLDTHDFKDERRNEHTNEVALDYNAAFFLGLVQAAVTRMP